MLARLIAALALVLHAAMHISFFMPQWFVEVRGSLPFDLTHSDLLASAGVDPALWQAIGTVLVVVAIGGLVTGAGWLVGLVPTRYGQLALALGALASLVSIVVFFHSWLVVGMLVDGLILAGVGITRWLPSAIDA